MVRTIQDLPKFNKGIGSVKLVLTLHLSISNTEILHMQKKKKNWGKGDERKPEVRKKKAKTLSC